MRKRFNLIFSGGYKFASENLKETQQSSPNISENYHLANSVNVRDLEIEKYRVYEERSVKAREKEIGKYTPLIRLQLSEEKGEKGGDKIFLKMNAFSFTLRSQTINRYKL